MASTELLQAYRATRYIVVDNGVGAEATVGVRLGRGRRGAGTARRPVRRVHHRLEPPQPAAAARGNEAAQQRLEDVLRARADRLPAASRGVGPDPAWEPEHGCWRSICHLAEAVELAEAFGQNAVVLVEIGQPARAGRRPR